MAAACELERTITRDEACRATDLIGRALPQILEEAAVDYDRVLVDAPPALGFPEPVQMATAVDSVALVALAGQTDRKALGATRIEGALWLRQIRLEGL